MSKPLNLKDKIAEEIFAIAEYMYSKIHEFPDEEKWDGARKLRQAANDSMFYAAEAAGNKAPGSTEYDWGLARKYLTGLKAVYRFSGRRNFIELEPEVMVRINRLILQIDEQVAEAYQQTAEHDSKDYQNWLRRYKIWKKTEI